MDRVTGHSQARGQFFFPRRSCPLDFQASKKVIKLRNGAQDGGAVFPDFVGNLLAGGQFQSTAYGQGNGGLEFIRDGGLCHSFTLLPHLALFKIKRIAPVDSAKFFPLDLRAIKIKIPNA